MHLFKCFVKFFKGNNKICLSIYHFEMMKIQKVCISNLSTVVAIKLSQQLSGLDLCKWNFVLFVEKIMGQIQLNTSNDINIIAIIWVLQPKWINPKFQTFYARFNRCLGCLKTGYSLLLLASSTMWCAGWSPILPGLFTNYQSPFSVASEEQILHIHPFFDVGL